MGTLLYRLGALGARRRRTVIVGWLLLVGVIVGLGVMFSGTFQASISMPGSPAQTALTKMDQHFANPDVQSAQLVFQAPAGHTFSDATLSGLLKASLATTARINGVTSVSDPSAEGTISADGRTAVSTVDFSTPSASTVPTATLTAVKAADGPLSQLGVKTLFGGDAFKPASSTIGLPEVIGVLVALMILAITFGSMLSAGLPLLTALLGVIGTMLGLGALASVFGISDNAPTLAAMLGLAVGIDYSLFIVSRHRSQLASGMSVRESIAKATATAGSAVVFAGATVIIALAGMTVAGVPMLTSMGLATAGAVALAVVMALTLVPALLAVSGRRLTPKPDSRAAHRAFDTAKPAMGMKWVGLVTRHPVASLISVTVGLLVIAAPALQLKLALTDTGSEATSTSTRQAYDAVTQAFGPGANGPLIILVEGPDTAAVTATAATVVHDVHGVAGIAAVSGVDVAKDGAAARVQITPTTGPRTAQTSALVTHLRTVARSVSRSSGRYVAVTGLTAVSIDVSSNLSAALLPFGIVVVGLSLLLLMFAFRSIAIPIKATVGFLLSLGSAFGATVAVFQWGWLSSALGVPSQGPIESFVPIIVMAVLFGLAMDYEVFLVSGMREDYQRGHDAPRAILAGARGASRVVVAAALIMISVFVSFLLGKNPAIMPIAFALAFGVLVDAFAVRMTLVPAIMTLLGDRAWALPGWLDRVLPHLDVEGDNLDELVTANELAKAGDERVGIEGAAAVVSR